MKSKQTIKETRQALCSANPSSSLKQKQQISNQLHIGKSVVLSLTLLLLLLFSGRVGFCQLVKWWESTGEVKNKVLFFTTGERRENKDTVKLRWAGNDSPSKLRQQPSLVCLCSVLTWEGTPLWALSDLTIWAVGGFRLTIFYIVINPITVWLKY